MNFKRWNTWKLEKTLPWLLIICGTIGLICSFIIMFEKLELLKNPLYVPSCDINPIVACGSVMASPQANAFGFPNPIIGLVAYPVAITAGVIMLAGVKLKRWFMLGLQAGAVFGLGFVHWLFFQSVYNINALCPYCIAVWIVTIAVFWYVTLYNLRLKNIVFPKKLATFENFLQKHHFDILIFWFLIITVLIIKHFWYYFGRNF